MAKRKGPPPTSDDLDDFGKELAFAGNRSELVGKIEKLRKGLAAMDLTVADWELIEIGRAAKKNYAQRLSTALAQKIADALRPHFKGIEPSADGSGHESKSPSASGLKKLDVKYSMSNAGLGLAVSIKTMNFRDEVTTRYTKNTKRIDGELRAEAQDCHAYNPYAVLAAYLFLPKDSATDGKVGESSRHANAKVLAARSGRASQDDEDSLFELAFLAVYSDAGDVRFMRPEAVPTSGLPEDLLSFEQTLAEIRAACARRMARRR